MNELTLEFDRGTLEERFSALGFNPDDPRGPVDFVLGKSRFRAFVKEWEWKHDDLGLHRGRITLCLFDAGVIP